MVLAAVKQDGRALKLADSELRADNEVVLSAVGECGLVLKYAAPEM